MLTFLSWSESSPKRTQAKEVPFHSEFFIHSNTLTMSLIFDPRELIQRDLQLEEPKDEAGAQMFDSNRTRVADITPGYTKASK
jgi:hypothetical protein